MKTLKKQGWLRTHNHCVMLVLLMLAWSGPCSAEMLDGLDTGPAQLAERVLDAFDAGQWDRIRGMLLEPDYGVSDEDGDLLRGAFNGPLHFSLARQTTVADGCQERQFAIRADTDHGSLTLQLCPVDGGWGLGALQIAAAPGTAARSLFDTKLIPLLELKPTYFACADDRALQIGEILHCEAGLLNDQGLTIDFKWHGEGLLEVVDADFIGDGSLPSDEEIMVAARHFVEPLFAGRTEEAFNAAGFAFADPVSQFVATEIGKSLNTRHGTLRAISRLGGQTNPGRSPPHYRFQLDFETSSAEITLALMPGRNGWQVIHLQSGYIAFIDLVRIELGMANPDPDMQLNCPPVDVTEGSQSFSCTVVLWGQTMEATIVIRDDDTFRLRMPPSLSMRLATQLALSERMLGWTFSQVQCDNDRPGGNELVRCQIKSPQGDKIARVAYRDGTLRILELQSAR